MLRLLALAGGFAGAVGLSQFPEFSQQYLQRLSGAVDELRAIVLSFDTAAAAAGLTRAAALQELSGTPFQTELQTTIAGQITRYEALSADYTALSEAEPIGRLAQVYRFTDPDLAQRTWDMFRPALPVTKDGLLCAGLGFLGGWAFVSLVFGGLARLLRRRPAMA